MGEIIPWLRPWVLLGLLALPPLLWLRWRSRGQRTVPLAPLQLSSPRSGASWLDSLPLVLEALVLALALCGLAAPFARSQLEVMQGEGVDVVLVLDISLSMMAQDFPPNRLEASRRVARDFIQRSGENRIGIVVFAKDALVHTPLTTDHGSLLTLLDQVTVFAIDQVKSGGTAIGDALLVAGERLEKAKIPGRDQAVILITDGESNQGAEPVLAARYLRHGGVRFYAIGMGGEEPVEVIVEGRRLGGDNPYLAVLDDTQLRVMTEAATGRYYRASDMGALEGIFAELARLESAPLEAREVEVRRPYTSRFAALTLAGFVLYVLVAGVLARRPLR